MTALKSGSKSELGTRPRLGRRIAPALAAAMIAVLGATPSYALSKGASKSFSKGSSSLLGASGTTLASVYIDSARADSKLNDQASLCAFGECVSARANAEGHSLGGSRMLLTVNGTSAIRTIGVSGTYSIPPLVRSKTYSRGFTVLGTGVKGSLKASLAAEASGSWVLGYRRADLVGRGRIYGSGSGKLTISVPFLPDPTVGSVSVSIGPRTRLNAYTAPSQFCRSSAYYDVVAGLKMTAFGTPVINTSATPATFTIFAPTC
jgi:hypothetical protein